MMSGISEAATIHFVGETMAGHAASQLVVLSRSWAWPPQRQGLVSSMACVGTHHTGQWRRGGGGEVDGG